MLFSEVLRRFSVKRKTMTQKEGSSENCRSTAVPYFDDDFGQIGERAARDEETGETYYVPEDMTYKEWEQTFVDGGDKSGLTLTTDLSGARQYVRAIHMIGTIDKDIYKCVAENIVTDEVIITDERIQHIKERHPNDYEQYYGYLKSIVKNPDYIIGGNKPNTALILKEIKESEGKQFKAVLRLMTPVDNPDFKNSIITFMKISEKEWSRLLKNKFILYKRE